MDGEGPVRIWHVRNSDRFGGPERLILDQCSLAAPGFEMVITSFGADDAPHPFLDAAAARGLATKHLPQGGSYDPRLVRRLRRAIESDRPDLLVGHDYKADLLLRLASRGLGIPRVAVVHGYTGENLKVRLFEALDRRLLRKMDAVIVVSEALGSALAEGGIDPDRIHVVTNAIDVETVAAAAASGRERVRAEWRVGADTVLLCLARLSPEKGQDVLLEAFATLRANADQPLRLVLVGDGATREALAQQARALGITDAVHFAGWRDDPHACLGAADIVVLPSRSEGFPLAALEAMAAGRAVVATRVGGVADMLDEGRSGALVPPDEAAALCAALSTVLGDPEARARQVAAARARVTARYGAEGQARALEAVYRDVFARR